MSQGQDRYGRNPGLTGGALTNRSSRGGSELGTFLILLKPRVLLIALCAVATGSATFVVTSYFLYPNYRAMATLRPSAPQTVSAKLSGSSMLNVPSLGVLAGLGAQPEFETAEEYMEILQSFDFTMALVDQYQLRTLVLPKGQHASDWWIYSQFTERFDCEYDRLGGALTLHFFDPDPATAQRVLGLYIKSLSDKLRQSEARRAATAVSALSDEAHSTDDPLLETQLYELMARQLEQQKLAQVETDFAFNVIQRPVVPDKPFSPRVMLDTAVASMLALFVICFVIVVQGSFHESALASEPAFDAQGVPRRATQLTRGGVGEGRADGV